MKPVPVLAAVLALLLAVTGFAGTVAETAEPATEPVTAETAEPTAEPASFVPDYEPDEPYPVRIAITKAPDKVEYYLGEPFDRAGMTVVASYSDHTRKEISDYTVENAEALTLEDTAVTLSYGGLAIAQPVTVTDPNADPATVEVFRFEVDGSQLYMVGYLDQHYEMPFGERFVQSKGTWSYADRVLTLHIEEVMMGTDELPYDLAVVPDANGDLSFTFGSVVGEKTLVCPSSVWMPALDGKVFE